MPWTVADVMTKEVVTVEPLTSFKTCADLMRIHSVSALPVVAAGDRLVGIVSEADLLRKEACAPDLTGSPLLDRTGGKESALTAAELMTAHVVTTTPDASLPVAARQILDHQVKRLPVVDTRGHMIGIVSRSDILQVFLRSDESIRREVADNLSRHVASSRSLRVEVGVRAGVVNLSGENDSGDSAWSLVQLAAGVPGVVGVQSHLKFGGARARVTSAAAGPMQIAAVSERPTRRSSAIVAGTVPVDSDHVQRAPAIESSWTGTYGLRWLCHIRDEHGEVSGETNRRHRRGGTSAA